MPQLGEIKYGREIGKKTYTAKFTWRACRKCGKERWVRTNGGRPLSGLCGSCSNRKTMTGLQGAETRSWKGGRSKAGHGYMRIRLYPDDFFYPMAYQNGYVLEHRLVVARALKRCLLPWETIHHKEGCARDDNRYPETLELLPSPHLHNALTRMSRYIRKLEQEVERLKRQYETE